MTRVSAVSSKLWDLSPERQIALEIVLLKHTFVLPWSQFLYADGTDDEIRLVFATHDVRIKGADLDTLLAAAAVQRLVRLHEPTRADQFDQSGSRSIREISVVEVGE
jgi:hypothetical protein